MTVRLVLHLGERAVEPDRGAGVVLDRSLDQERADETEHDGACEMPDGADARDEVLHLGSHLLGLRVLEERPGDAPVGLIAGDADEDQARQPDQERAGGPAENAGGGGLRAPCLPAVASSTISIASTKKAA